VEEDIYSMYYVYEHYKKDTGDIFYVGIGKIKNGKYERAYSNTKRNRHWHSTVKKHGFIYSIVFESNSREDVCNKEIELIYKYGRKDLKNGPLVNKTTGGEKSFEMSIYSIKKGVIKRKKNGTYNKCSEIARERMLKNNPWKGKTHDGFNKRKIYQYDAKTGDFISEYKSINYATRHLKFTSPKIISKCLSGKNKTGGGYIWFYEYKGEKIKKIRIGISNDQIKPVIEFDSNGNIIKEWECISDAAKEIGITSSWLGKCINSSRLLNGRIFKIK
jgi:hypothetical protein